MTQQSNLTERQVHPVTLTKRMLQGAVPALILIVIFVLDANNPKPEWGKFWMVRPLIVVPLAGAMGGAFYYIMDHLRYEGGWKMVLGILLSVVGYIVAVWLGTVLGLAGTYWD